MACGVEMTRLMEGEVYRAEKGASLSGQRKTDIQAKSFKCMLRKFKEVVYCDKVTKEIPETVFSATIAGPVRLRNPVPREDASACCGVYSKHEKQKDD